MVSDLDVTAPAGNSSSIWRILGIAMRIPKSHLVILLAIISAAGVALQGQTKGPAAAKGTPKAGPAKAAAKAVAAPPATLAQLMKGIFFPNANVIFAAQDTNPADVKPAADPSLALNPLENSYGKWEAVENSALALAEAASLLTVPGRKCSNGKDVPIRNADWASLVQGLRQAGLTAYKAAQAKDQDKILDAAEGMTNACSNCHDKYREVADRCVAK
jgi:hypothetical protein